MMMVTVMTTVTVVTAVTTTIMTVMAMTLREKIAVITADVNLGC